MPGCLRRKRPSRGSSKAAAALAAVALLMADLPAWASSLAAWRVSRSGQLELRTSIDVRPQAFFEAGTGFRGPRVWVDLPGAPSRTRTVRGSGALREVRIGRPDGFTTRLVLEFAPGTQLDPSGLRLVGTSRDRWRMELPGLGDQAGLGLGFRPTTTWERSRTIGLQGIWAGWGSTTGRCTTPRVAPSTWMPRPWSPGRPF